MSQLEAAASSLRRFAVLLATVTVAFIGLGIGIGLTLTASGVLATHDGSTTIHACVDRVSSVPRIVDNPNSCTRYERLVEWQNAGGAAALEARISTLEQETAAQQVQIDALQTDNQTQQDTIDTLETQLSILGSEFTTLTGQVDDLQAWQTGLGCIQSEAGLNPAVNDIVFTACNVHVRNGRGQTETINGLGNLIVGYNENDGDLRDGSHNLVVGPFHSYPSYGGFVAGRNNTISGKNSSVSGGSLNTASGDRSSISGGADSTASGIGSFVASGQFNVAEGLFSSVSGGYDNIVSGGFSTIGGGAQGRIDSESEFDSRIGEEFFSDGIAPNP